MRVQRQRCVTSSLGLWKFWVANVFNCETSSSRSHNTRYSSCEVPFVRTLVCLSVTLLIILKFSIRNIQEKLGIIRNIQEDVVIITWRSAVHVKMKMTKTFWFRWNDNVSKNWNPRVQEKRDLRSRSRFSFTKLTRQRGPGWHNMNRN